MSHFKAFALASCVGLLGAAFAPTMRADEWNKRTILTVNEPIQVPNATLQPGKYVMKLLDSPSNRHIVQIFDANEQHLITTVLAIPNYRLQPTGKTEFGFWETPAGQPKALRSWFYPGDNFGQEFAYPKNQAVQIAAAAKENVPTTYAQSESELTTARVATVTPSGEEKPMPAATETPAPQNTQQNTTEVAQNTAPAPATPAATPAATPQTLPHTASPYPLIGLFGLLSIAGYGVMTLVARRAS
ncbi:MAG TPA: hypothetical protein VFA28_04070 [Bryobacteraceae bacterium]|nr:hypothetical protein [Bryobacteraceae bacterium]